MVELTNVGPAKWELSPKEGRVPVWLYANAELAEKMKRDRTLWQANNVSKLPGIIKAAEVMPDGHEGYGFPIGGVAAFGLEGGIISPGGVGYDINCLAKGTKVLTSLGYTKPIEEFEQEFGATETDSGAFKLKMAISRSRVRSIGAGGKLNDRQLLCFMKKRNDKRMIKLRTRAGFEVLATEDHPFMTREGMKPLGSLPVGSAVAVLPFQGVEFEEPSGLEIISEKDLRCSPQAKEELSARNLLPLRENSPAAPLLAKLIGYLLGDGCVYFSQGKGYVHAYGEKGDMEQISRDIATLGFSAKVYARQREHKITDQYGEKRFSSLSHELHATSTALAHLLVALGMPLGRKTSADFGVPGWIMRSRAWVQRLFVAGLFGAELSSPATHSKTGFYSPVFAQNKNASHLESGREFAIQVMQLLEGLGVKCTKISVRKEFRNKEGETLRIRLLVAADEENLLRLWRNVGFEYNSKRQRLANIASHYILLKKSLTREREEARKRAKEYKKKGLAPAEIKKLVCSKNVNERFIERSIYEDAGQRITLDFPSFRNFVEKSAADIAAYGTVFDGIEETGEIHYDGEVYDFTVEEDHNFLANGFLVSNCGVRMILTNLTTEEVKPKLNELMTKLFSNIPSGVGSKGRIRLTKEELAAPLREGAQWAISKGYGWAEDAERIEESGRMGGADPSKCSDMAMKRGAPQFGTLGAGNHFLEVQKVAEIVDEKTAKAFGIESKDQVVVMLHCGSRGFGHQVCDDYIRVMLDASRKYGINLPDRELCCAPINSKEAQDYVGAMYAAVNYAFCNRQVMTHWIRETFQDVFKKSPDALNMRVIYDVCHNIAKFEEHELPDGKRAKVCVHRKGATRSFAAGRKEVPQIYRAVGQPVIIPGSMGTASYLLAGTEGAMRESWGSTCHGAGRTMSRHQAIRDYPAEMVQKDLDKKGIVLRATGKEIISEEASGAYKDVSAVVASVQEAGLSRIVVRLEPMGVAKG